MNIVKENNRMRTLHRCNKHRFADNQGFTLIETMIGLLIFTVGILGVSTMTVVAINSFTRAKTTSVEVSRTTSNTETLKQIGYENSSFFNTDGTSTSVYGSDGAMVNYTDTDNAVVRGTKLIVMQNTDMKGQGAGGDYTLYYTKPIIE
jgi:prepilin-type N-terminal cleavage/methylation domain-containing protein